MNVVIIGNGVAGVTVATEIRKKIPKAEITIISGETKYHYSRPALMYIYMRDLKKKHTQPYENKFWKKQNIKLVHDWVKEINFNEKTIHLENNDPISYQKLVLAIGAKGNKFGWPGQDLPQVITFTNLQDLEKIENITHKADKDFRTVIVGGGLIGIEVAEMMHHRNIQTTFMIREKTYWEIALSPSEGEMIQEEILDHKIDLRMNTELMSISSNKDGNVDSITTNKEETIKCNMVVLTAGVSPNVDQFKGTKLETRRGILVNQKMETNIKDVYACGDCAEIVPEKADQKSTVELLWYTGKMQGKIVAENIMGEDIQYERGIWYNSAKFFTIDYHTYGQVNHNIPGEKELYYRFPNTRKSIRIVYLPDRVIGFNTLGIRFRHRVCEEWIREKRSLDYVLSELPRADFDPEFFKHLEERTSEWIQKRKVS